MDIIKAVEADYLKNDAVKLEIRRLCKGSVQCYRGYSMREFRFLKEPLLLCAVRGLKRHLP